MDRVAIFNPGPCDSFDKMALTRILFPLLLLIFFSGCTGRKDLAPVEERKWVKRVSPQASRHYVRKGETLYSIAFKFDRDYRCLAAINYLTYPYTLKPGSSLWLNKPVIRTRKIQFVNPTSYKAYRRSSVKKTSAVNTQWQSPLEGKIINHFSLNSGKKGIDIASVKGSVVRAANQGVIAYSGSGLSGYGNLIIIKHENQYLTAYGYNASNLVVEGQRVKAGQVIAKAGLVDRRFWGVHFEIRRAGKPVDPLRYIPLK